MISLQSLSIIIFPDVIFSFTGIAVNRMKTVVRYKLLPVVKPDQVVPVESQMDLSRDAGSFLPSLPLASRCCQIHPALLIQNLYRCWVKLTLVSTLVGG